MPEERAREREKRSKGARSKGARSKREADEREKKQAGHGDSRSFGLFGAFALSLAASSRPHLNHRNQPPATTARSRPLSPALSRPRWSCTRVLRSRPKPSSGWCAYEPYREVSSIPTTRASSTRYCRYAAGSRSLALWLSRALALTLHPQALASIRSIHKYLADLTKLKSRPSFSWALHDVLRGTASGSRTLARTPADALARQVCRLRSATRYSRSNSYPHRSYAASSSKADSRMRRSCCTTLSTFSRRRPARPRCLS